MRSKACVCGRSLAGAAGSNPAGGIDVCCKCCVTSESSATGRSYVQSSLIKCGVFECDSEASVLMRPLSTRECCAMGQEKKLVCSLGS